MGWCLNSLPVLKFWESLNLPWDLNDSILCDVVNEPLPILGQGRKAKRTPSSGLIGRGLRKRKWHCFGRSSLLTVVPPSHLPLLSRTYKQDTPFLFYWTHPALVFAFPGLSETAEPAPTLPRGWREGRVGGAWWRRRRQRMMIQRTAHL